MLKVDYTLPEGHTSSIYDVPLGFDGVSRPDVINAALIDKPLLKT